MPVWGVGLPGDVVESTAPREGYEAVVLKKQGTLGIQNDPKFATLGIQNDSKSANIAILLFGEKCAVSRSRWGI